MTLEAQMVVRTLSGAVIWGAWEVVDTTDDELQQGTAMLLRDSNEVIGVVRDGEGPLFVRVAAVESMEYRTRPVTN